METSQFHYYADQLQSRTEEMLDNFNEHIDIDYEIHGNVMAISVNNGAKIIMNRQEPLHQIWLATANNGYHFDFNDGQWRCIRSNQLFDDILRAAILAQSS